MADQLYTAAEAAGILKVRESWLKTKAAARLIPCTFIGKHLRFSDDDIAEIMKAGARQPVTSRERRVRPAAPPDAAASTGSTTRDITRRTAWRTRRSGGGARSRGG